jgi:GH15 family glucan-1,4-alpha-glucosidase
MIDVKPPPGSHAILIGVSTYESPTFLPIPAAYNSLKVMRELLTDRLLCGWDPEQVTFIPNPPRADDLALQIAKLAKITTGALLIYFVGHGTLTPKGLLSLTVTGTLPDHVSITGLSWHGLQEILHYSPARTKIVILDCCYAGHAIETLGADDTGLADNLDIHGVYTLTATMRNRTAHVPPYEHQENAYTSFTGELRDIMISGIPGGPETLTFGEIYPVLRHRLLSKGLPAPSQRGTDSAGTFPFAHNRGRKAASQTETRSPAVQGWSHGRTEQYSMLADGANHALLTPDGRVTWMCHPRPDSGSVFADLLGGEHAGHFSVQPVNAGIPLGQRYVAGTMTVETRWPGLAVTDWLDSTPRRRGDLNATVLVREVSGEVPVKITFAPRPEFGQLPVQLQPVGDDGLRVLGGREPITLRSPGVDWHIETDGQHALAVAVVDLAAIGGSLVLEMRAGSASLDEWKPPVNVRRRTTEAGWRNWSDSLKLPPIATELFYRSALTFKALCYRPTGAILTAETVSPPEGLDGVRSCDYRFCWIRDAAMTANALVDLGSLLEAEAYLAWIASNLEHTGPPERLAPFYDIEGQALSPVAVIPDYADIHTDNPDSNRIQLNVFGPMAMLIEAIAQRRGHVSDFEEQLLASMVEAVAQRWHERDYGFWETRQAPRHHVYSKVMCWVTVDRAIKVADQFGVEVAPTWSEVRDAIARSVLELGWNGEVGAYTAAFGHDDLDAASLWVGLSGLLAADDPRYLKTVLKIEAALRSGPTVFRGTGLPSTRGGFIICAVWLAEAYLQVGRRADAKELFEKILAYAGPTGLLPEQWDPITERGFGNHSQAYSHVGLIRLAKVLSEQGGRNRPSSDP